MKTRKRSNNHQNTKGSTTTVFSKKQYNDNNGMLTKVWGPGLWHYLHTMSFNYPIHPTCEQKKQYRNFMLSLEYVLPCKYCRVNFAKNLKTLPLTMARMENRDTFSRFVYDLHEIVNKMLGKKSTLSFCDVRERYEHFRARCTIDEKKKEEEEKEKEKEKGVKKDKSSTHVLGGKNNGRKKKEIEKGCTEPLSGKKSRMVLTIVPDSKSCKTFIIHRSCLRTTKRKKKKVN